MNNALRKLVPCFFMTVALTLFAAPAYSLEERSVTMTSVLYGDEFLGIFKEPSAVFHDDSKGRLYVADSVNSRLISFDSKLEYLSELVDDAIVLPVGIVKSSKGIFYVLDASTRQVVAIDATNKTIETLYFKGIPKDSEKFVAGSIAIGLNDMLYLTDMLNKRVVVFDDGGEYLKTITTSDKALRGFNDIRVDARGYLYAVDSVGARVFVFDDKGQLVSSFGGRDGDGKLGFPVSVAVGSNGLIYLLDRHRGEVVVFNEKGLAQYTLMRKGYVEGKLHSASYIYIDSADTIYVVDGSRVQIFKED